MSTTENLKECPDCHIMRDKNKQNKWGECEICGHETCANCIQVGDGFEELCKPCFDDHYCGECDKILEECSCD